MRRRALLLMLVFVAFQAATPSIRAHPSAGPPRAVPRVSGAHSLAHIQGAALREDGDRRSDLRRDSAAERIGADSSAPPETIIVYVTNTGAKYHRDGCRFLARSKIPLELAEAKKKGYTPCGVCKPPE